MSKQAQADALFDGWLFGQRQVLGCTDQQIDRSVMAGIKDRILEALKSGYEPKPTVFQKYCNGEYTDGVEPKAWLAHDVGIYDNVRKFFVVIELLAAHEAGVLAPLDAAAEQHATKADEDFADLEDADAIMEEELLKGDNDDAGEPGRYTDSADGRKPARARRTGKTVRKRS